MQLAGWRKALFAVALVMPSAAFAESSAGTGQAGLSAAASIHFKIVIPEVLALQVGATGANTLDQPVNSSVEVHGARSGIILPQQPGVTLRSNMRQVTVIQDGRGQAVYTVVTP
jgi:hypothetical protein